MVTPVVPSVPLSGLSTSFRRSKETTGRSRHHTRELDPVVLVHRCLVHRTSGTRGATHTALVVSGRPEVESPIQTRQ